MGNKSDFFGAVHSELKEVRDNFTSLLINASQIEGVKRLNHSLTRGDFDGQRSVPGLGLNARR